jgi:glycosidase
MVPEGFELQSGRSSLVEDLANAPGTLPQPEVEARFRALESQFRHDNTIEPLAPGPTDPVEVWATIGSGLRIERALLLLTADGSDPGLHSISIVMETANVTWDVRTGYISHWRAIIPAQPSGTTVRYRIGGWKSQAEGSSGEPHLWAHDGSGFWFRDQGPNGISTFAYRVEDGRDPLPAWMSNAIIYQVFLDRFHLGTPDGSFPRVEDLRIRHGGTIEGVRRSLPYLSDLGVTCLWLSPLHPSESYHRYDTMDFFAVDPELGSERDLRSLIDESHARGIKIVLDFVPSHLSWHHPAFLAAQQDENAASSSWFTFYHRPHDYRSFLNMSRHLPSINTDDPLARQHLLSAADFWVRDMRVDGFRLDHAIGPGMDFWVALRTSVQAANPDVVLFGEVTDTPDCLRRYRGKLHGVLDFELAAALRLTFGRGGWDVARFDNFITSYERFMEAGPGRVSFLDNHDMDRFLWVADNDVRRLKLAAICQFTLAPTPVVYYGTEIGLSQQSGAAEFGLGGDAEARRDMIWDESAWNSELLAFYRALIRLRKSEPALSTGMRRTIHVDESSATWAYLRRRDASASRMNDPHAPDWPGGAADDIVSGDLIVAFNLSDVVSAIPLPITSGRGLRAVFSTGDDPLIEVGTEPRVEVAGFSAAILRVE